MFLSQIFDVMHQWIRLNELYKLMESFFSNFKCIFELFAENLKNIQTNSEGSILIKVQCVVYQWICLYKLYKLMWSFFQISESFFELAKKN